MFFLILGGGLAFLGGLSYWLGLWDKIEFKVEESLLADKELVVLVAKCNKKDIGKNVMRLVFGSKKAIDGAHEKSSQMQEEAATAYGVPPECKSLNVGVYLNDPKKEPGPRWAIGWAVAVKDFEEAKNMAKKANEIKTIEEEIVAVRLGGPDQPILKGRLRWRNQWTPMIAPYFTWAKAMKMYESGGYKSIGNNEKEHEVAIEVYVMQAEDKGEWIDYIVLYGDVRKIWSDLGEFPLAAEQ